MNSTKDVSTVLLTNWEEIKQFRTYVDSGTFPILAFDLETDGLVEQTCHVYGIGLCFESHEAFYIPIRKLGGDKWWTQEQEDKLISWIISLCASKKLIGHNIAYDVLVFHSNWQYNLAPHIYSDTILQKHLIDEERPFGLKEVAVKYLGAWADKAQKALHENIEKNGGSTTKINMEMYKADTEVLGEYCAYDVILTRQLFDIFEAKLIEEKTFDLFYKDEIMPLYKEVTIPMKMKGFNVNVPYFNTLNENITSDIEKIKERIHEALKLEVVLYEEFILNKNYPIKKTGLFPKMCAEHLGFVLPVNEEGKTTLSKKALSSLPLQVELRGHQNFLDWLRSDTDLDINVMKNTQVHWFFKDNPEEKYIFNINSNNHLKWLFFEHLQETPLSKTETGEPQVDDDFIESMRTNYDWVPLLLDYKKLMKLKSTYIEGILNKQVGGVIHSDYYQYGPPSGRYASREPNCQNLPRVKEEDSGLSEMVLSYSNSIKKGFIAPAGYKIINADYSQLEPRAFAEACGDVLLQNVFNNKEDLYGSIAKNIWNLDCGANEVKKKYVEKRQGAKIVALAAVYGAGAGRISKLMNISYEEAQEIIDDYLNAYPGLRTYMETCDKQACRYGFVKTKFGRIRHLPEAKRLYDYYGFNLLNKRWTKAQGLEDLGWKFKNMLNLAKNFPIQGVAAHTVNRAAIAINRQFKALNIDACIVAQVHDELTCISKEVDADRVKYIMKHCMENTTKLSVPLIAEPLIADNWAEAK